MPNHSPSPRVLRSGKRRKIVQARSPLARSAIESSRISRLTREEGDPSTPVAIPVQRKRTGVLTSMKSRFGDYFSLAIQSLFYGKSAGGETTTTTSSEDVAALHTRLHTLEQRVRELERNQTTYQQQQEKWHADQQRFQKQEYERAQQLHHHLTNTVAGHRTESPLRVATTTPLAIPTPPPPPPPAAVFSTTTGTKRTATTTPNRSSHHHHHKRSTDTPQALFSLDQIRSAKLKHSGISRSPGGTPSRSKHQRSSMTGDGLTPMMSRALRRKFATLDALSPSSDSE